MGANFDLLQAAKEKVVIAAHRGLFGGNIPCNTIAAFDAALAEGADMVELDVSCSCDGELFVFHGGLEQAHLGCEKSLTDMPAREIRKLRCLNQDRSTTVHGLSTLDEVFEHLKGRCYINVDKFALYMAEITHTVRRHGIGDQILVKTDASEELFQKVEEIAPDLAYIPIIKNQDIYTRQLLKSGIRFVGVEAVFETEDAPICQGAYMDDMHSKGLILWGNGIVYSYKHILSAGHSDDVSITGNPDAGWGWLADKGFDIIQTDWPSQVRTYLQSKGKLMK